MMFKIPEPELQVCFARALTEIRNVMLQDALLRTVGELAIPTIDNDLAEIVPEHSLATLASRGLRGELMFAVPCVIAANPRLVGYYRLLYGYSQKEFHRPGVGGLYKVAEVRGTLSKQAQEALPAFCRAMARSGALLLAGISAGPVDADVLDDLSLLTLGPQWRGRSNVNIGTAAIAAVFGVIKEVVSGSIANSNQNRIELKNAAGRSVLIEFAADPDIIIREEIRPNVHRGIIAIEVKGGLDFSNIHNRIGEAEKSHQKAKAAGYEQCWTVVNVDRIDTAMAARESPTTNRFYRISDLVSAAGDDYDDFRARLVSLAGIVG